MPHHRATSPRRLAAALATLAAAALVVPLSAPDAGAATGAHQAGRRAAAVPAPRGLHRTAQDWYSSRLTVAWLPVRGATYQVRWATSASKLSAAPLASTGATSITTPANVLSRASAGYFQVRAVKSGRAGSFSPVKAVTFLNPWPQAPSVRAAGVAGGVTFTWPTSAYASRYRVRYSPAWYGGWPGAATYVGAGWLPQSARSTTFAVPTTAQAGDGFLAVPYANPVFAQLEANNQYHPGNPPASRRSSWVMAFPVPPQPPAGDQVRFGTYNLMLSPANKTVGSVPAAPGRVSAIVRNIAEHHLDLAALQESAAQSVTDVVQGLRTSTGQPWAVAGDYTSSPQQEQVIYRSDLFRVLASGTYDVPDRLRGYGSIVTPWARLQARSGSSRSFVVSSVHFNQAGTTDKLVINRGTGEDAQTAMAALDRVTTPGEPLVVAGDMRYGREPYGENPGSVPAQPTFVRAGFYDAMAALTRTGSDYNTVSAQQHQTVNGTGLGARADYILEKNVQGSYHYENVVNWPAGGTPPSDHNLVFADLSIPAS